MVLNFELGQSTENHHVFTNEEAVRALFLPIISEISVFAANNIELEVEADFNPDRQDE